MKSFHLLSLPILFPGAYNISASQTHPSANAKPLMISPRSLTEHSPGSHVQGMLPRVVPHEKLHFYHLESFSAAHALSVDSAAHPPPAPGTG